MIFPAKRKTRGTRKLLEIVNYNLIYYETSDMLKPIRTNVRGCDPPKS